MHWHKSREARTGCSHRRCKEYSICARQNHHYHPSEECPVRAHQGLQQPGRFLDQEVGVHLQFFSGQLHVSNKVLRPICGAILESLPAVALATREEVSWPLTDSLRMDNLFFATACVSVDAAHPCAGRRTPSGFCRQVQRPAQRTGTRKPSI